jgi:DNA-binding response OmpR family regulator
MIPAMMTGKTIYLIEDQADLRDLVARSLADYGYLVKGFSTGQEALTAIEAQAPDLCLIDLGLPDMDGMAVMRRLGDERSFGIIILTGRGGVSDRVLGLELGADDYVVKPFEPRELVARVSSVLRRTEELKALRAARPAPASDPAQPRSAQFGPWSFDSGTLTLTHGDGRQERLSRAEADLLSCFLRAPKRVLSRDTLQGEVQDADDIAFDRAIDVRISRLRKKLDDEPRNPRLIKTVYGAGYLFSSDVIWK